MRDSDYDIPFHGRRDGGAIRSLAVNALAASFGLTLSGFLIYAMAEAAASAGLDPHGRPEAALGYLVTASLVGVAALCAPLVPRAMRWPSLLALAVAQLFFAFAGVVAFFA